MYAKKALSRRSIVRNRCTNTCLCVPILSQCASDYAQLALPLHQVLVDNLVHICAFISNPFDNFWRYMSTRQFWHPIYLRQYIFLSGLRKTQLIHNLMVIGYASLPYRVCASAPPGNQQLFSSFVCMKSMFYHSLFLLLGFIEYTWESKKNDNGYMWLVWIAHVYILYNGSYIALLHIP